MDEITKGISEAASCTEAFRLLLQTQEPQSTLRVLNPDRSLCGLIWVKDGKTIIAASRVTGSTGYMALLELLALKQSHFQLAASSDLADGEILQLELKDAIDDEAKFIDKIKAIIWPVAERTLEVAEPGSDKAPDNETPPLPESEPLIAEPPQAEPETGPAAEPELEEAAATNNSPPAEHLKARQLKDKLDAAAGGPPSVSQAPAVSATRPTIPKHIWLSLAILLVGIPIVAVFVVSTANWQRRCAADDRTITSAVVQRVMDEQSPAREPQHALRTAK